MDACREPDFSDCKFEHWGTWPGPDGCVKFLALAQRKKSRLRWTCWNILTHVETSWMCLNHSIPHIPPLVQVELWRAMWQRDKGALSKGQLPPAWAMECGTRDGSGNISCSSWFHFDMLPIVVSTAFHSFKLYTFSFRPNRDIQIAVYATNSGRGCGQLKAWGSTCQLFCFSNDGNIRKPLLRWRSNTRAFILPTAGLWGAKQRFQRIWHGLTVWESIWKSI